MCVIFLVVLGPWVVNTEKGIWCGLMDWKLSTVQMSCHHTISLLRVEVLIIIKELIFLLGQWEQTLEVDFRRGYDDDDDKMICLMIVIRVHPVHQSSSEKCAVSPKGIVTLEKSLPISVISLQFNQLRYIRIPSTPTNLALFAPIQP